MNYWLMKSEPDTYSWSDLEKDKKTTWEGVRNFQARNNLREMKKGDLAFFYHSNIDKAIVGIAKITKQAFADPNDEAWLAVEIAPVKKLKKHVTLTDVKQNSTLAEMVLVKNSRLSVQPVKKEEFELIEQLSEQ
jgi:predicted RNA-binding protein with PUA-like domain